MEHQILGEVVIDKTTGEANATIEFDKREVSVKIIPDDILLEVSIQLAADVVRDLDKIASVAKKVAAAELRETYNDGWNVYDEVQPDGSLKSVSNPELSEHEFMNKLSLNAINILGGSMVDLFFDDENMFWGHTIIIASRNGVDFQDAFAELFG